MSSHSRHPLGLPTLTLRHRLAATFQRDPEAKAEASGLQQQGPSPEARFSKSSVEMVAETPPMPYCSLQRERRSPLPLTGAARWMFAL